jgi:hypothetical protein
MLLQYQASPQYRASSKPDIEEELVHKNGGTTRQIGTGTPIIQVPTLNGDFDFHQGLSKRHSPRTLILLLPKIPTLDTVCL